MSSPRAHTDRECACDDLRRIAEHQFGDFVKAVVDVQRQLMAIGAELHADEEAVLIQEGSRQADLWGINLYLDQSGNDLIEFDSMINVRLKAIDRGRSRTLPSSD